MLHILFPFDMSSILISFAICFTVGLVLSVVLIYHDVKLHKQTGLNQGSGSPYLRERVLAAFFGACQAVLSVAGITAIVFALRSRGDLFWIDMAVRCNVQLLSGTNVSRPIVTLRLAD